MPQIVTIRTKDDSAGDSIAVVLSQDAVCLGPDGQPWSGVSLKSEEARKLAARLLSLVKEIEKHQAAETANHRPSINPISDLASILVFHDGSEQSHRAFRLALDFATRSLAHIQLAGVFGIQADQFEPSALPDDYEWQRGWLERLTASYSGQAAKEGIELRTTLVAANDQLAIGDLFNDGRYDLIIVPCKFSGHTSQSGSLQSFIQSLAEVKRSKILFCP
jgi:nucleotide-binding universal stress UspA family protein